MVAEIAAELPAYPHRGRDPLVIPNEERQPIVIDSGKVRVGRLLSRASFKAFMPIEHQSSDVWNIYMNGYTATGRVYEPIAEASAQLGMNSVTIDVDRGLAGVDLLNPWDMLNAERYQQRAVSAVMDYLQRVHGVEEFYLKTHSMSGRAGVGLAEKEQERVAGVTLTSIAGIEPHNLAMMVRERLPEFFRGMPQNIEAMRHAFDDDINLIVDYLWHNASNPLRTLVEGLSIAHADVSNRVKILGVNDDVKVSIIDAASDPLIPNKRVVEEYGPYVDYAGVHPNPTVDHVGPQTHSFEFALENHRVDQLVDPERVYSPRSFSVMSLSEVSKRRKRTLVSVPKLPFQKTA